MMESAANFRSRAADYRRMAEAATDDETRRFRVQMAEYFDRAAAAEENPPRPGAATARPG
jgi:hypothetical protein